MKKCYGSFTESTDLQREKKSKKRLTAFLLGLVMMFSMVSVNVLATPTITIVTHPANATVTQGSITGNLSVVATVTTPAALTFQWYSNTTASNIGGTQIPGATSASFPIPTNLAVGTHHFYVEVSATGGATPVRSNAATVTVNAPAAVYPVTVAPAVAAYVTVSHTSASAGNTITVTITPPANQRLAVNGITATGVTAFTGNTAGSTSVTFIKTAGATVVNATFEPIPQGNLFTVTRAAASTVPAVNMAITPAEAQAAGTPMTVTITPPVNQRIVAGSIAVTGVPNITLTATGATFPMPGANSEITVNAAFEAIPAAQPAITTTSIPNGTRNIFYSTTFAATGTTPITWSVSSGSLPPGLTLSTAGVLSGTPTQTGNFTFTVRAANEVGNNDRTFSMTIFQHGDQHGTFLLTLRAGTGGDVAIDRGSFGETRTGRFAPGDRVTISARPDRDYYFDRWSYNFGDVTNRTRAETTFIMPNRDVTVWADFIFYRDDWRWDDWRRDDWRRWDWTPVQTPPAVTTLPQPTLRAGQPLQQNQPAADTASFTFNLPTTPTGRHPVTITGLPPGVSVPSHAEVANGELRVQFTGISRAAAGTHNITLVLNDNNGNPITIPLVFSLTTTGTNFDPSVLAVPGVYTTELRLTVGNTMYTLNGMARQSDAAPFIDPAYSRLMVPLRTVAEGLGAQITWIGETNTVIITNNMAQSALIIGVPLPGGMGTPVIVNGRAFVPLRYVAETLGANVEWDWINNAVYIRQ